MEVLGIDIGGSGIKGALVDIKTGNFIADRHRIPTPAPSTPEAVAQCVQELAAHFDWKGKIGCGFPAPILHGVAKTAANIHKRWVGTNVDRLLSEATGCEVHTLNDADAAGLAAARLGAGRGRMGVIIFITVGTGLGTSIICDGKLLPNTELGHLYLDNGREGEHWASDAVRKKEDLSWQKWAIRFDHYLKELEKLFWPDLFIIGGGASKKTDKFLKHLTVRTEIVPSKLRNHAGIIGAAMAAVP
jgi:polyphosphate glucokinase